MEIEQKDGNAKKTGSKEANAKKTVKSSGDRKTINWSGTNITSQNRSSINRNSNGANRDSVLRIGVIDPEVLGTYGDGGNALVLRQRARLRGVDAEIVKIHLRDEIPDSLDIYTLGGGEDTAQSLAAEHFQRSQGLVRAAAANKPILAICASLQVLGVYYTDAQNRQVQGLGLLDAYTEPQGFRSIGELITEPVGLGLTDLLTGFENHGGATTLGEDAQPLGKVLFGQGNDAQGFEGAIQGSVVATYMHGPVLARNPQLADWLLEKATGSQLSKLDLPSIHQLRKERLVFLDK